MSLAHLIPENPAMSELVDAFDEYNVLASVTRESFFIFVQEFWDVLIPEEPVWNWHIKELCDELQSLAERVFRGEDKAYDLIVNIPPGTTKSTIVSIMFPAWVWVRMPTARFICGSYADDLALDLSRKSRDVVQSERYQKCFPRIKLNPVQNTKSYWANTFGGFRFSVGTGGNAIGRHGHFIIVDDPIDPNAALSKAMLADANIWMDEHLSQRKVSKALTPTILIMQRLHQDDPTGNMIAKGTEIRHICLPATDSSTLSDEESRVKPATLREFYRKRGGLLDPIRLSPKVLSEAEKVLGQYGYAGQYDQDPIPRGGGMFKVEMLKTVPSRPAKLGKAVRYWDKAGTKNGGAYTVGVLIARDLNKPPAFYVLDVIRGQWEANEREAIIDATARADGKGVIIGVEQEPGSAGKDAAMAMVRRLAGWRVKRDKVTGDKESRADTFAIQVNSGNVYLVEAPWNKDYIDEMRYFPRSKYKDQIDASSGSFNECANASAIIGAL